MKTDLAPRHLYIYYLMAVVLGLIIASIFHQSSMDISLYSDSNVPFIITTTIWCVFLLLILFIFNKCRYLVATPTDDNYIKVGNLLSHSQVSMNKINVEKKILLNLFKVKIDNKEYYIFSSDQIINEYKISKG